MKIQNTFKANVIWGSLGFSLAIIAALLFDTQQTISYLAAAKAFIFSQFSWFYILLSAFFLFFLLFLALGRYGDIKLGLHYSLPLELVLVLFFLALLNRFHIFFHQ